MRPPPRGPVDVVRGNALDLAAANIADDSVDLIVTSPPYFGLRSYQDGGEHYEGQIGAEATPAEFVDALIAATREMVRVLKPSGSIFVNLGDRYVDKRLAGTPWRYALRCIDDLGLILRAEIVWSKPNGLPESVTDRVRRSHETWFHLTKSPRYYANVDEVREPYVPSSVEHANKYGDRYTLEYGAAGTSRHGVDASTLRAAAPNPLGKLPGSVWTIATQPLRLPEHLGVRHFAAFPMEWPRRLIRGWSPSGICTACEEGRRSVVAGVGLNLSRPQARRAQELADAGGLTEEHLDALLSVGISDVGRGAATQSGTGKNAPEVLELADEARAVLGGYAREYLLRRPTSMREVCACAEPSAPTMPAVVLDPFGGTGTTALVASALGRRGVSVDLSEDYCRLARWRTSDPIELARAAEEEPPRRGPTVPAEWDTLDLDGVT